MMTFATWWFGIGIVIWLLKTASDLYEKHFQGKYEVEPYSFLNKWMLVLGPLFLIGFCIIALAGLVEAGNAKREKK